MASRAKRLLISTPSVVHLSETKRSAPRSRERDGHVKEVIWDIFAISNHMSVVRRVWAGMLGVTGPQWLIIMAIDYLDSGNGVSIGTVSAKLHVNQTFVVAQSKLLEAEGVISRRSSEEDARVVLLSLTERTQRSLQKIASRRNEINDFIFSELTERGLKDLSTTMSTIRTRLEHAALMLHLDRTKPLQSE
jgi:MarR family transcriptional regulator, organic hydroperoxide resistance regulator